VEGDLRREVSQNIKRLMAYSSIAHMGFALIGLAASASADPGVAANGVRAMLLYMAIYVVLNIGTFAFILAMERDGRPVSSIESLSMLSKTAPVPALALLVLAAGTAYAGFVVTAVSVSVIVVRFAERRPWAAALTYGVACAVIGLVCFGWLLRVDLPEGPIERAFYSLVR